MGLGFYFRTRTSNRTSIGTSKHDSKADLGYLVWDVELGFHLLLGQLLCHRHGSSGSRALLRTSTICVLAFLATTHAPSVSFSHISILCMQFFFFLCGSEYIVFFFLGSSRRIWFFVADPVSFVATGQNDFLEQWGRYRAVLWIHRSCSCACFLM